MLGLEEAIQAIKDLAVEAARAKEPRIVPIPGDPRNVFVDRAGTGGWEKEPLPPAKRSHRVDTIEDLARLARYALEELELHPVVWHNEHAVVLVFNQRDLWDSAAVTLHQAPQWQTLAKLAIRTPIRQRELITLLRVDLAGCLPTPRLINAVSHVNFRAASHGESIIQQGRESLGRSVESEIAGVKDAIPDRETVRVPLYQNVGERELRWDIECDLEVNAAEQVFVFRPLPGEMEEAIATHQADIRGRLIAALGDDVPVYAGSP